jgi:CheY-like chemotaxis protein
LARKVLLADDSVTAQNMGRRILVDAGYEVVTVNNGSSALKKVAESKPDLIVLDVYMPGYGGLEVCQRIRESQETARIPVLLTVGKLEPFKAEEATRVRADAFIVKPFEASELLTALTKLEDKIVPQPGSRKSGRAKAADDAAYAKEFGDIETGWKNRLKIPPPHQPRPATSPSEAHRERPSDESGTADIQMQSKSNEQAGKSAPAVPITKDEIQAEQETAEFAVRSENASEDVSTPSSESKIEGATSQFESRPEKETAAPEVFAPDVPQEQPKAHEDEVAAALASLVPSNGHGSESAASEPEPVPITMAAAGTAQEFSGPRWIAQEIALKDDESSLILEQEMHKAFAALAAADAARMSFAPLPGESPQYTSLGPQAETVHGSAESRSDEPISFASVSDKQEPAAAPAVPPDETQSAAPAQIKAGTEQTKEVAAFAAAASVGTTAGSETSVGGVAISPASPSSAEPPLPTESRHDADLAAAWASWKQVRDSVSAPEFTSQIADAAASGFQEIRHEEPTTNPEPEAATPPAEENGAIASIVDSVLAELKPKLMEEISKKMKKKQK